MSILTLNEKERNNILSSVKMSFEDNYYGEDGEQEVFVTSGKLGQFVSRLSNQDEKSPLVFEDIDFLKSVVLELQKTKIDFENIVTDMMFSIEVSYQNWYDLDEDNWDLVA